VSGPMLPSGIILYAAAAIAALAVVAVLAFFHSTRLRQRMALAWRAGIATLRQTWLYFGNARRAIIVFLLAVLGFMILFGAVWFIAKSLDLGMTYPQVMAFMPVLMLAVLLPVTINGHGLREVILIGFFTWLGLGGAQTNIGPKEHAVAFSLLFVANDFISVIPGCCLYFAGRRGRVNPDAPS